jgi:hypothetical protein
MVINLHKQMTEIRIHGEMKCRKIFRPESDSSLTVQMWYNRIHPYLQLKRMKEGKTKNTGKFLRFTQGQHINAPEELTLDELKDGLQFAHIRKADLCKQAKGLWWLHQGDFLINAQEKKQHKGAAAIKQKCQSKEGKRM